MSIELKSYPASCGDSFLLRIKDENNFINILIDGGIGATCFRKLSKDIEEIKKLNQCIDLLVITHIDDDHIKGIINLFEYNKIDNNLIKKVWFNSGIVLAKHFDGKGNAEREIKLHLSTRKETSVKNAISLELYFKKLNIWKEELVVAGQKHAIGNIKITVLSPTYHQLKALHDKWEYEKRKGTLTKQKGHDYNILIDEFLLNNFEEDKSIPNGSSIAFLLEFDNKRIIMMGDAYPSVVSKILEDNFCNNEKLPVKIDLLKVSHHGSKKNTSDQLLRLIDCESFLISSDGSCHGLPDKECLARIIKRSVKPVIFYFNYPIHEEIFTQRDKEKKFECVSVKDCPDGITLRWDENGYFGKV